MTLAELANFVCGKVRQTDTRAIAKCKEFIARRYELIYNDALWRDSLYLFAFTFTPNSTAAVPEGPASWDATHLMPTVVDKVIAIRSASQEITATGQEILMRGGFDAFAETGAPVQFATLAPCVNILPSAYATHDLGIEADSPNDTGSPWTAHIVAPDGTRTKVTELLVDAVTISISSSVTIIERVTKQVTAATVNLNTNGASFLVSRASAIDTSFPLRLPVRFFPTPTAAVDLRALVKKKFVPLADDADVPELRNVDLGLIAYAQADMWEYARQIGKAQAKFAEAAATLSQLKMLHTWQEQTLVRAVPEVFEPSGVVVDQLVGKGYW